MLLRIFTVVLGMCLAVIFIPHTRLAADSNEDAAEILKQTGVTGGFVVHLGIGSGELTAALKQGEGIQVQGLDRDPEVVQGVRERIRTWNLWRRGG